MKLPDSKPASRKTPSFANDTRAIEGLPVRLVIALVIGVASLGLMLQILGGVDMLESDTEVDVQFDQNELNQSHYQPTVTVVDEEGNTVPDATVIAAPGDARMDSSIVEETDSDGEADFDFRGEVTLPPDAHHGSIEFEIQPPSDSNWVDDDVNDYLLVTSDT